MKSERFSVNQAWLAATLNEAPLVAAEGPFNLLVLMDVASGYIIGQAMVPLAEDAPTPAVVDGLFQRGWDQTKRWPATLLIAADAADDNAFASGARDRHIEVSTLSAGEIAPLLAPLKTAFAPLLERVQSPSTSSDDEPAPSDSTNPNERSPYAPVRLRDTPAWHYAREAAKAGWVTSDGMIASTLYQDIRARLVEPMLQELMMAAQRGEVPSGPEDSVLGALMTKIVSYEHWIPLIAQFESNGRQIFDLNDRLVDMLVHTDVDDVTLADLHTPYDAFFVRFGRQEHVRLPFDDDFEYVDGAFVARASWDEHGNRRMKVGFSMVHKDGRQVGYPGLFMDLLPHELQMTVPNAIAAALQRRLASEAETPSDGENQRAIKAHLRAEIEDSGDLLRHCASLLFNALFYLESIEHHVPEPTPGRDTPPDRLAKWLSQPTKRHKMRSALTSDGFAIVRLVGNEVDAPHGETRGPTAPGVRVHWRRGHWRMQPFGPQRSQRRRTWIKPVLVGGDAATAPNAPPGHIYMAPEASDRIQ